MKALCVDSEFQMLEALKTAVESSPDITLTSAFEDELAALEWAKSNQFDIAFLSIRLHTMDGIELAEKLLEINPGLPVVFCTEHSEYAIRAFKLRASGYLLKPISADDIQREIDHIKGMTAKRKLLTVRCFGTFDVYYNGVPVSFKRQKTKELFAYLIDRKGAVVSSREICAQLWEEEKQNLNYLHQLIADLRRGLKSLGAEAVLLSHPQGYSVDTSLIDCDYYKYLDGNEGAKHRFTGEYMSNYSWSEFTCAFLQHKTK